MGSLNRVFWALTKATFARSMGGVLIEAVFVAFALFFVYKGSLVAATIVSAAVLIRLLFSFIYNFTIYDVVRLNPGSDPAIWVTHKESLAKLLSDKETSDAIFAEREKLHCFLLEDDLVIVSYQEMSHGELLQQLHTSREVSWSRRLRQYASRRGTVGRQGEILLDPLDAKIEAESPPIH